MIKLAPNTWKNISNNGTLHEGVLLSVLKCIFPSHHIVENTRKEAANRYPDSGKFLELDFWIPELSLCFEFQDSYHFTSAWYSHVPLLRTVTRDYTKQAIVRKKGGTLIIVPCWWAGDHDSLMATIHFERPDLFPHTNALPLPLDPSPEFFKILQVPDVGELMLASFPVDIKNLDYVQLKNEWWMGEKYDGIRCCWNNFENKLYTRFGKELFLPSTFISLMPAISIDAEIWFGRGSFASVITFAKMASEDVCWHFLRVVCFDTIALHADRIPFETRYALAILHIESSHAFINTATRTLCISKNHLDIFLRSILEHGGEGAMLRKVGSPYEHGRSNNLLKLKATQNDKEALVLEVTADSITLKLPNNRIFEIPVENVHPNAEIPAKGDVVTFGYESNSRGAIPVNATILRIRTDVSWEEVVYNFTRDASEKQKLNEYSHDAVGYTSSPVGYWTERKGANIRKFFERVAKSKNLDPLMPDTWYLLSRKDIESVPGGSTIMHHLKGGYIQAMLYMFPDIGLDPTKFHASLSINTQQKEIAKRREQLEEFARTRCFDPLLPENWYYFPTVKIHDFKLQTVFRSETRRETLRHLFPEIGLDVSQFKPGNYWQDITNRERYFRNFAKAKQFDPLTPNNWYAVHPETISAWQGGYSVLEHYKNRAFVALSDVFPQLPFDEKKFIDFRRSEVSAKQLRLRRELEKFAEENGEDFLVPEFWYCVPKEMLSSLEGAHELLAAYGSFQNALVNLFPFLDSSKFANYHHETAFRKNFFENFAKTHNFDPLISENWYHVTKDHILAAKGGKTVMTHYTSLGQAVIDIFPGIGLDKSRFIKLPNFGRKKENRRQFFEKFAKEKGFNPLEPQHWYSVLREHISQAKLGRSVMAHYKTLPEALVDVFPSVPFDRTKFRKNSSVRSHQ
eukprot:Phypoly_transcript_00548.p1 GENE.Phypoly_transcript_00548~~Phypoly_transcript_00548.p1  ORF type:complete len:911 (+),score=120.65 Phypoly_transcript_00548:114-2846(+)